MTVEFARYVGIVSHDKDADRIRAIVVANYEATKTDCFPDWPGDAELVDVPEPLGRFHSVGWRAFVPDRYVRLHPTRFGPELPPRPPDPDPRCGACGAPVDDDGEWIGEIH